MCSFKGASTKELVKHFATNRALARSHTAVATFGKYNCMLVNGDVDELCIRARNIQTEQA